MNDAQKQLDWIADLAADVSGKTAELQAERQRLLRLIEEAKTASDRLEQVDGLLKVAAASGRLGSAKPTALSGSDKSGADGDTLTITEMILVVLRDSEKALDPLTISNQIKKRFGAAPANIHSAVSRLKKRRTIRVATKVKGKALYRLADSYVSKGGNS